ncbi:hypothetical protein KP509_20G079000 [Ceratopteris richardii]|uniref:Cytosolic oligopeptidase A n=1 Tax=Ceratopteris richardii TaxID=49495 RepID=A0A8T2SJR0_CERRI|nr:hypothetical protein KP509_20G079000 [Ceratopteris richardii]
MVLKKLLGSLHLTCQAEMLQGRMPKKPKIEFLCNKASTTILGLTVRNCSRTAELTLTVLDNLAGVQVLQFVDCPFVPPSHVPYALCSLGSLPENPSGPEISLRPADHLRCDPIAFPFDLFTSSSNSLLAYSIINMASVAVSDMNIPEPDACLVDNPLLADSAFPRFEAVEAKHVVPGIRAIIKNLEEDLAKLEKNVKPTWSDLVEPLERIVDRLTVAWGTVSHLKSVKDSSELRTAVETVQPEKVDFQLKLGQSKPIHESFKAIREGSLWGTLTEAQQRVVDGKLKEARLNGVGLDGEARARFNEIRQELEKLSTKFSEHVLDSTKKFEKLITNRADIAGLPATALGVAAQAALTKGHEGANTEDGPWLITLDIPSYMHVMQHVRNRSLREELYRAYVTRAFAGELDNTPIINRILELRLEQAKLLGFNNYAEVSLAMKMATLEKAEELLEDLRSTS